MSTSGQFSFFFVGSSEDSSRSTTTTSTSKEKTKRRKLTNILMKRGNGEQKTLSLYGATRLSGLERLSLVRSFLQQMHRTKDTQGSTPGIPFGVTRRRQRRRRQGSGVRLALQASGTPGTDRIRRRCGWRFRRSGCGVRERDDTRLDRRNATIGR